ncbi:MAG: helicase-related protein [Fischerella sp.]|nr:helicase-related protein [Fischerella sp.]
MLLRTDAAAKGLNFQFCRTLINYDMSWNPMRVSSALTESIVEIKSTKTSKSLIYIMKIWYKQMSI